MRVLHLIDGLDVGGAEVMLAGLASAKRDGVQAEVISLTDLGPVAARMTEAGVPVHALGLTKSPLDIVRLWRFTRRLRADPPDVLATWLYESDLLGGIAARLARRGTPVVWGVHQSALDPTKVGRRKLATVAVCARLSWRIPSRVIACSSVAARAHVERGYDPARLVVVPNGVDLDVFRPDPVARAEVRAELGVPDDAPLVGFVARFDPQKDHRGFLAAARLVVERMPQVRFVLVGKGMDAANAELAAWADLEGVADRLHLLGLRSDLARLDAAFDVAVMPSAYGEAFSVALVEAMACGVPCAVTDVGDSATLVGEGGRSVPPGDPAAFAEAVVAVHTDRVALGRAARARVVREYGLDRAVDRYVEIHRQAAAGPRRRIAVFLPRLLGGGAERVTLDLAAGLAARDLDVDLVLGRSEGPLMASLPPGVHVVDLGVRRTAAAVPALARHLRRTRPHALLSALSHANLVALAAVALSGTSTHSVVTEHQHLSTVSGAAPARRDRMMPMLLRRAYPRAGAVVAVSRGVADDLEVRASLRRGSVVVAPNPIDAAAIRRAGAAPPDHLWFAPGGPPVVVAVGRLTHQKGFDVLVESVAVARDGGHDLRVIILGEGEDRPSLEARVGDLGLEGRVQLPGWVDDPMRWMGAADCVALSSRWEGLPTVLLEALALGAPIVATDCPSGPREVLEDGRLGTLVPVGDAGALADAIVATIGGAPRPADGLRPSRLPGGYEPSAVTARYAELLGVA